MTHTTTKVAEGGRIVIPADIRREMGIQIGDEVILKTSDGELRILSRRHAILKAQALVRKHVPKGRSLVKQLLRDRRRENAGE